MKRLFARCVCVVSACVALHACADDGNAPQIDTAIDTTPVRTVTAPGDSVEKIVSDVMNMFLEASREGSPTSDALDTLTLCDAGSATPYLPTALLATWELLPFETRGDTVVARASVTTVAEQDIDGRRGGFVARQRIRTDILEWDVYRTPEGNWVVCNGLRFGYVGADSLTRWVPEGASLESARQLADSISGRR